MVVFSIDGVNYDVKCQITRTAEMTASEISGMMLDKSYFNDVLGTFMKYDVTVSVPLYHQDKYAALYEVLTDPVDAHSFVMPYNNGRLTITGRVTVVSDQWERIPGGRTFWRNTRFTVIANHPSKAMNLSQVVARGRSPLPPESEVHTGDVYVYTGSGWQDANYGDADNTYY